MKLSVRKPTIGLTAALAATIVSTQPSFADDLMDFYKGRQLTILIGHPPGGSYDLYAQLTAAHIGKFIPGNPTVIVQHMPGGGGAKGYPNLIDDDWLWGGSTDAIQLTIAHGVRNENPDSRQSQMPAFGRDDILPTAEIYNVASYVRSLSGLEVSETADLAAGKQTFADNCASCHGEDAKGNREFGAPNLTDAVWLYGSAMTDVVNTITNARNSSMPDWGARLDPTTVKALAVYVHSLGGGE